MYDESTQPMYPLSAALEAAGVKPGKFHRHFYGGALGNALTQAGEISAHISHPMRGAGVGRGGGRLVSVEGAICLGVFYRLISGGVHSAQAIRIAQTFTFLGESGDGLHAFHRNLPRPAGKVFPGNADTFVVAINDANAENEAAGFAFVPGPGLTACDLAVWLGLHDADESATCIFSLSEVCRKIREGLSAISCVNPLATQIDGDPDQRQPESDMLGAFLVDCAIRDDAARTPTHEFFRAFAAWTNSSTRPIVPLADGSKRSDAALVRHLSGLGIRRIKSHGNKVFAGFRWRESPVVREYLATAQAAT